MIDIQFDIFIFTFSAWPIETSNINFEKMNRRIEHIARLKADASKNYSEPFMVSILIPKDSPLYLILGLSSMCLFS